MMDPYKQQVATETKALGRAPSARERFGMAPFKIRIGADSKGRTGTWHEYANGQKVFVPGKGSKGRSAAIAAFQAKNG